MLRGLYLLLPTVWSRGIPLVNQANTLPLDILTALFGTADSFFGGVDIPLSTAIEPFMLLNPPKAAVDNYCTELYKVHPRWSERAAQVERDGVKKGTPHDWISLIDGPEQLAKMSKEQLECLHRIGYVPNRVPLGQVYGRILWMIGPSWVEDIGQATWGGKIIVELQCDSKRNITISCNNVGYGTAAFAHASIGGLPEGRAVSVLDDEILKRSQDDWFWINYSQDFSSICPSLLPKSYMARTSNSRHLVAGMFDNAWPARDVLDLGRWVGRDIDEDLDIYLYKSRIISFADGRLTEPVIWFSLKSADLVKDVEILRF